LVNFIYRTLGLHPSCERGFVGLPWIRACSAEKHNRCDTIIDVLLSAALPISSVNGSHLGSGLAEVQKFASRQIEEPVGGVQMFREVCGLAA
jgi:hypothetical protein